MAINLESLIIEFGADFSQFDAQLARASKKAETTAKHIERNTLTPRVNDEALTKLNKHLDLKVKHLDEVRRHFKQNPIVVEYQHKQTGTVPNFNQGNQKQVIEYRGTVVNANDRAVLAELKELKQEIKGLKPGLLGRAGGLAGAGLAKAASLPFAAASHVISGVAVNATKDLGRGIEAELNRQLKLSIGSLQGLGTAVGRELIKDFRGIGDDLNKMYEGYLDAVTTAVKRDFDKAQAEAKKEHAKLNPKAAPLQTPEFPYAKYKAAIDARGKMFSPIRSSAEIQRDRFIQIQREEVAKKAGDKAAQAGEVADVRAAAARIQDLTFLGTKTKSLVGYANVLYDDSVAAVKKVKAERDKLVQEIKALIQDSEDPWEIPLSMTGKQLLQARLARDEEIRRNAELKAKYESEKQKGPSEAYAKARDAYFKSNDDLFKKRNEYESKKDSFLKANKSDLANISEARSTKDDLEAYIAKLDKQQHTAKEALGLFKEKGDKPKVEAAKARLKKLAEKKKQAQALLREARVKFDSAINGKEELSVLDDVLGRFEDSDERSAKVLADLNAARQMVNEGQAKYKAITSEMRSLMSKKAAFTKKLTQQEQIRDLLRTLAKDITGRDLADHELPEMVSESALGKLGYEAAYDAASNRIFVKPEHFKNRSKMLQDPKLYQTITHELSHGYDAGFGSDKGFLAALQHKTINPLSSVPSAEEMAAPFHEIQKQAINDFLKSYKAHVKGISSGRLSEEARAELRSFRATRARFFPEPGSADDKQNNLIEAANRARAGQAGSVVAHAEVVRDKQNKLIKATNHVLGAVGHAYDLAKGVEDVALAMIPYGEGAKKVLQHGVIPGAIGAAAFGAIPGLAPAAIAASHFGISAAGSGLGALGIGGGILSGPIAAAAHGLAPALAGVGAGKVALKLPMALANKTAEAIGLELPGTNSATQGKMKRAIEAVVEKKARSLPAANVAALPPAAEKAIEVEVVQTAKALNEAKQAILPAVGTSVTGKSLESLDKINQRFIDAYKQYKAALKKNPKAAAAYAETLADAAEHYTAEIDDVAALFKQSGQYDGKMQSKLANRRAQITKKLNEIQRDISTGRLDLSDLEGNVQGMLSEDVFAAVRERIAKLLGRGGKTAPNENLRTKIELDVEPPKGKDSKYWQHPGMAGADAALEEMEVDLTKGASLWSVLKESVGDFAGGAAYQLGRFHQILLKNPFYSYASAFITQSPRILGSVVGLLAVGGAFAYIAKNTFQAGLEIKRLKMVLDGMGQNGSQKISELRALGRRVGTRVDIEAYKQFKASTEGTTLEGNSDSLFGQFTEGFAGKGLSAEQQSRAFLALQQVVSKGKISAEELRQQLSEALPGAYQIAARSMGLTVEELNKRVEEGTIKVDTFMNSLARQVKTEGQAGQEALSRSAVGDMGRIGVSIDEINTSVGESVVNTLAPAIKLVSGFLQNLAENADKVMPALAGLGIAFGGMLVRGLSAFIVTSGIAGQTIENLGIKSTLTAIKAQGLWATMGEGMAKMNLAGAVSGMASFGRALGGLALNLGGFMVLPMVIGEIVSLLRATNDEIKQALEDAKKTTDLLFAAENQPNNKKPPVVATGDFTKDYAMALSNADKGAMSNIKDIKALDQGLADVGATTETVIKGLGKLSLTLDNAENLKKASAELLDIRRKSQGLGLDLVVAQDANDVDKIKSIRKELMDLQSKEQSVIEKNFGSKEALNSYKTSLNTQKEQLILNKENIDPKQFNEKLSTVNSLIRAVERVGKATDQAMQDIDAVATAVARNIAKVTQQITNLTQSTEEKSAKDRLGFIAGSAGMNARAFSVGSMAQDKQALQARLSANRQALELQSKAMGGASYTDLTTIKALSGGKGLNQLQSGDIAEIQRLTKDTDSKSLQALLSLAQQRIDTEKEGISIQTEIAQLNRQQVEDQRQYGIQLEALGKSKLDFQNSISDLIIERNRAIEDFARGIQNTWIQLGRQARDVQESYAELQYNLAKGLEESAIKLERSKKEVELLRATNSLGLSVGGNSIVKRAVALFTEIQKSVDDFNSQNEENALSRLEVEKQTLEVAKQVRGLQEQQSDLERSRTEQLVGLARQQDDFVKNQGRQWNDILFRMKEMERQAFDLGVSLDQVGVGVAKQGENLVNALAGVASGLGQGFAGTSPSGGGGLNNIVDVGKWLQGMGYTVGEQSAFNGGHIETTGHSKNSLHYSDRALDINADSMPGGEAKNLDKLYTILSGMKEQLGITELLWKTKGHFDHLHVGFKSKEFRSGVKEALAYAQSKTGLTPSEMATILAQESSNFKKQVGGTGNNYRGGIQWGPNERKTELPGIAKKLGIKYNGDPVNNSPAEQIMMATEWLLKRGMKFGSGIAGAYSKINPGYGSIPTHKYKEGQQWLQSIGGFSGAITQAPAELARVLARGGDIKPFLAGAPRVGAVPTGQFNQLIGAQHNLNQEQKAVDLAKEREQRIALDTENRGKLADFARQLVIEDEQGMRNTRSMLQSSNELLQNAKGYLTVQEELDKKALDVANSYQSQLEAIRDRKRELKQSIADSPKALDDLKGRMAGAEALPEYKEAVEAVNKAVANQTAELAKLDEAESNLMATRDQAIATTNARGRAEADLQTNKTLADFHSQYRQTMGQGLDPFSKMFSDRDDIIEQTTVKYQGLRMEWEKLAETNSTIRAQLPEILANMDEMASAEMTNNFVKNNDVAQLFAGTLTDIATNSKSVGDAFRDLATGILKLAATWAANQIVSGLFGGMFQNGGSVGNFANGGPIQNFASGGSVLALGLSMKNAIAREGHGAIPIVAHVGEQVLTDRNGDAQLYRAMRRSGAWNELKNNGVANFAVGGQIGASAVMSSQSTSGRPIGGTSVTQVYNISTPDADSFRKSRTQMLAEAEARSRRAFDRNR